MIKILLDKYLLKFPLLKQFIKFCIVGGTAALINFSILYSLTEWLNIWYVISNVCGGVVSGIFNFFSNKNWTFRNKEKGRQAYWQMIKFIIVISSGLVVHTLIVYSLTEFIAIDYRLSWVAATGIITLWNFVFNRFWTFRQLKLQ
ncbi:MAG: GtrA family protein [Patescibacteria group bacterium]|jgi:putative flippase GtrA